MPIVVFLLGNMEMHAKGLGLVARSPNERVWMLIQAPEVKPLRWYFIWFKIGWRYMTAPEAMPLFNYFVCYNVFGLSKSTAGLLFWGIPEIWYWTFNLCSRSVKRAPDSKMLGVREIKDEKVSIYSEYDRYLFLDDWIDCFTLDNVRPFPTLDNLEVAVPDWNSSW